MQLANILDIECMQVDIGKYEGRIGSLSYRLNQKDENIRLCPLDDNGSSLCCDIDESKIDSYLGNDKVRFNSLINSKSTSRIRINKMQKKRTHPIRCFEFFVKFIN